MLSPVAALVRLERWQALSAEDRRSFPPLCPDLVVELLSPGEEGPRGLKALRRRMAEDQATGARLGWLLLPRERAVEIWPPPGDEPRCIEPAIQLEGGAAFPGLQVALGEIWEA